MKHAMPKLHKALLNVKHTLEEHFKEAQDFEFTIQ